MKSLWNDGVKKPEFEALCGDIKTDVLIIGGGLCGILCAYMLKHAGVDCALVEADKICNGVTGSTTAKITFQHGLIYDKLIKKYGFEKAQQYYMSQKEAFDRLTFLASETDSDFTVCDSYVYSLKDKSVIEKEVTALNKIGCDAEFCTKLKLPFEVSGAVRIKNQANFHPLKFAYNIAKDLKIYENTKVTGLAPHTAVTNNGKITANKIIVATHFPIINKHGGYFLKMYQHRSYVIALKNAPKIEGMYVDEAKDGLSFRSYGDLLLLGGGGHRTGGKGGGWA
ncbi:MAG: FAD-binding oxidoreductase, partial [Clostridia bacterium]|nr:FAD-binding oxidoreductase [Clostridia bacterium]